MGYFLSKSSKPDLPYQDKLKEIIDAVHTLQEKQTIAIETLQDSVKQVTSDHHDTAKVLAIPQTTPPLHSTISSSYVQAPLPAAASSPSTCYIQSTEQIQPMQVLPYIQPQFDSSTQYSPTPGIAPANLPVQVILVPSTSYSYGRKRCKGPLKRFNMGCLGDKPGAATKFTGGEEAALVEWIFYMCKMGYPVTKDHLINNIYLIFI
uniref:Uncharacterized protein n=1 Tax=Trichogramma kaykai TaxID=54128 RepID=A0ABD2X082_9HYME